MPSNTQILESIKSLIESDRIERLEYQKEQAQKFLKLAAEVSDFKNHAEKEFDKIKHYLENNTETNQKGGIQRISDLEEEVGCIRSTIKVTSGKLSIIGFICIAIGSFFYKIISIIF